MVYICLSYAMTGDHVTHPAFSCITFERLQYSMKHLKFMHKWINFTLFFDRLRVLG